MARALRQALRDAIRRKRRVYGQVLQTPTDIFRVFDRDGTGKLSADDLKQALTKLGLCYTAQQLHLLSEFLDTNGDGAIDYREMVRMSQFALPLIASYATDLSSWHRWASWRSCSVPSRVSATAPAMTRTAQHCRHRRRRLRLRATGSSQYLLH